MKKSVTKRNKTPVEKFLALSDVQKDAQVARFENGEIAPSRALNAAERRQWRRIKRRMGRPTVGKGAKVVAVTIERGLLDRVNRYAKAHGLKRAELIARGLELIMAA
jgi:hypothetical protein